MGLNVCYRVLGSGGGLVDRIGGLVWAVVALCCGLGAAPGQSDAGATDHEAVHLPYGYFSALAVDKLHKAASLSWGNFRVYNIAERGEEASRGSGEQGSGLERISYLLSSSSVSWVLRPPTNTVVLCGSENWL